MGFEYSAIRRAAYHSSPEGPPLRASYLALPFPERWRSHLLDLCNVGRATEKQMRTVPTYRMDGVLQTLVPDLVVRGRSSEPAGGDEDFWLYAPAAEQPPLSDATLRNLLTAWLRDLRPEQEHRGLLERTLEELQADLPAWKLLDDVDLLGCPLTSGGTAAPAARQYQLATDYLARRIARLEPYEAAGVTLRFRTLPRGPRQQGAELMSQPLKHDENGHSWWFSVVLNISLHTVPFSPLPRLHLHTGIRRWATRTSLSTGRVHLPAHRHTSVYLRPPVPWLNGVPLSERYAIARLRWNREQRAYDWRGGDPAGILGSLGLESFPRPQEILSDPAAWIGENSKVQAAVVHSTHMGSHGVGAGLMSHQRSQLVAWAEQALPEGLIRATDLRRSWVAPNTAANVRLSSPRPGTGDGEQLHPAHARRTALAHTSSTVVETVAAVDATAAPILEARLLWQTETMRDTAIEALAATLDLDGDGIAASLAADAYETARPGSPVILRWRTPELTVHLRCLKLTGGLAEALDLASTARPGVPALSDAIKARRSAIAAFLTADGARPSRPTLALVEIDRRDDFPTPRADPKFALRLGCADAGVITQFTAVPKRTKGYDSRRNTPHRARSAWQDGFRQLGVRVLPQHTLGGALPADLQYAAVWMVKRRTDSATGLPRHVPVAVLVEPDPQHLGEAAIRGWDSEADNGIGAWIPYPQFLLRLTALAEITAEEPEPGPRGDSSSIEQGRPGSSSPRARAPYRLWKEDREKQRQATARYLQRMLRSPELRTRPTMLITHAQNSRSHWPWLQDSTTVMDQISTGLAPAARLRSNIRLLRVRSTGGHETPQWWGTGHPSGINGLPAGLWTELAHEQRNDQPHTSATRVFYSTTGKASTFKATAVEADKLAGRRLRTGKSRGKIKIDTGVPAWNPALVEITVLGCQLEYGDDPQALALAAHQLRQAPDYLDALSLPLPLHLAGRAQEYVLPTLADGTQEDNAQEDDEDISPSARADGKPEGIGPLLESYVNAPAEAEDEDECTDLDPDQAYVPGLAPAPEREGDLALAAPGANAR